jgi:flagellin-like hook-associated protein FlgL
MSSIIAIPTSRVSDLMAQQQLLAQMRSDQAELLRLQRALASGQRIGIPSEDAPAALRAIDLQRLLERKTQIRSNLSANQGYLQATDNAVADVAGLLAEVRAAALAGIDTGAGEVGKQTAARQVEEALTQVLNLGNTRFRGRYLFAGADTQQLPFTLHSSGVEYQGDEGRIASYGDIGVLFDTNVSGEAMFGVLSEAVRGTADLDARLTADTRLADLNGGQGVSLGSFAVSDGTNTSVIDIGAAETIGDVAALLERFPPAGQQVRASVGPDGLLVELIDPPLGSNLSIKELGQGTTAAELGILSEAGVGVGPLVGSNLNPALTATTRLDDILGVRATARIGPAGERNDLVVQAAARGSQFNGVTITFVAGGAAGAETVVYDDTNPLDKKLIVTIEDGVSTAAQVKQAIDAHGLFTASADPEEADNDLSGTVQATAADPQATAVTAGGSGIDFDQAAGLRIANGGESYLIDLDEAVTVEDLLNALNGSGAAVYASINAAGNGIDVRSRLSGVDFSIGENGGLTATHLGLRTFAAGTRLADLNHGGGVPDRAGVDFQVRRKDGTLLDIDLAGADSVEDVLALVNTHPANALDAWRVTARLAAVGNGIELVTTSAAGTSTFAVLAGAGPAAEALGLVPVGAATSSPGIVSAGAEVLTGRDVMPHEVHGTFSALVRLRDALRGGTVLDVERAVDLLDEAAVDLNFARSELGSRQQTIDNMLVRLDVEEVELRGALSLEVDLDLAKAITDFTSLQASIQTQLQLAARISQLTLLDFL